MLMHGDGKRQIINFLSFVKNALCDKLLSIKWEGHVNSGIFGLNPWNVGRKRNKTISIWLMSSNVLVLGDTERRIVQPHSISSAGTHLLHGVSAAMLNILLDVAPSISLWYFLFKRIFPASILFSKCSNKKSLYFSKINIGWNRNKTRIIFWSSTLR